MSVELTEHQKWIIIEHLHNLLDEFIDPDLEIDDRNKAIWELLDILSPNWKEADSCADVISYSVYVGEKLKEDREKINILFDMVDGGLHRVAQIKRDSEHRIGVLAETVAYLANIVYILINEEDKEVDDEIESALGEICALFLRYKHPDIDEKYHKEIIDGKGLVNGIDKILKDLVAHEE